MPSRCSAPPVSRFIAAAFFAMAIAIAAPAGAENTCTGPVLTKYDSNIQVGVFDLIFKNPVWESSSAVAGDGNVVFVSTQNGHVDLVHCENATCSSFTRTEIADLTLVDGTKEYHNRPHVDVAIGTDGFPVIVYEATSPSEHTLRFVKCANHACTSSTTRSLATANLAGDMEPTVAIGSDGFPIIAYMDRGEGELKVVHCNNASCSSRNGYTIHKDGDEGYHPEIAIAPNGKAIIAHADKTNGDVKLAVCADTRCSDATRGTLDDGLLDNTQGHDLGSDIDIAVQASSVTIAYPDNTTKTLKMIRCSGGADCFQTTPITVPNVTDVVGYIDRRDTSVAVAYGRDNLPIFAYSSEGNISALGIAHCNDANCTSSTVTRLAALAYAPDIVVAADGLPVIPYLTRFTNEGWVLKCDDIFCRGRDFGDATSPYASTNAAGGACHGARSELLLGTTLDVEQDARLDDPDGDNATGGSTQVSAAVVPALNFNLQDETGVGASAAFLPGFGASVSAVVTNTTGSGANLGVWFDWNRDGDWGDSGERVVNASSLATGTHTFNFTVPAGATVGATWARARLSTSPVTSPTGFLSDGEVEDYSLVVSTVPTVSINDASSIEGRSATFTVTRTSADAPATVHFSVTNDTASSNDWTLFTASPLEFAAGQLTRQIAVFAEDDALVEASETYRVQLTSATGATISDSSGNGTIQDDDLILLEVGNVAVTEGDSGVTEATFVIHAKLDVTTTTPYTVSYGALSGTATAGVDFLETSGNVTFAPGDARKEITVPIVGDTDVEGTETFTFNIDAIHTEGATVELANGAAIGTITTDDNATVTVSAAQTAFEHAGSMTFTLTLDSNVPGGFTIGYATGGGTATAGADYVDNDGTLAFAGTAGESRTITIELIDDTIYETSQETFDLSFTSSLPGVTVNGNRTNRINNDDNTMTIADRSCTEGNAGAPTCQFTVTLVGFRQGGLTVDWTTADGSAMAGSDYLASSGTVTFLGNGGDEQKTFNVRMLPDTIVEGDETFTVHLTTSAPGVTLTRSSATGTITNDDSGLSLFVTPIAQAEGDSGTTPFEFRVKLTGNVAGGFSVPYTTVDGTAIGGSDFATASGTLTFAGTSGETKSINVLVQGDPAAEGNETFSVQITPPAGVTTSNPTVTATILNDDSPLGIAGVSASEKSVASLIVTLGGEVAGGTTVAWSTSNGTAKAGTDYVASSGTLTFEGLRGEEQIITVPFLDDASVESDETFFVTLANATSTATLPLPGAMVTIENDDPTVTFSGAPTQGEGDSGTVAYTFLATLDIDVPGGFALPYSIEDGTAIAGSDYTDHDGTIVFAGHAGEQKTITVAIHGDTLAEPSETFTVTLGATPGVAIVNATQQGTILDDDSALAISDVTITEGDSGTKEAIFRVTLEGVVSGGTQVSWTANATTASNGSDFDGGSGTLHFIGTTGEIQSIAIPIHGDTVAEGNERFTITLSDPTNNVRLGDAFAIGTIVDDETSLALRQLTDASQPEGDSGTTAFTFAAELAGNGTAPFTVRYRTDAGTATAGSDFTDNDGTLTFSGTSGEAKTFTVLVHGDTALEPDETFTATLFDVSPSIPLLDATQLATIATDDVATVTVTAPAAREDDGVATVTATVDRAVPGGFSVDWATTSGTASELHDFTPASGTLTFSGAAGESKGFTFPVIDDAVFDDGETVLLQMTASNGVVVLSPALPSVTILDDDPYITVEDISVLEGTGPATPVSMTLTLHGTVPGGTVVRGVTVSDTATNPHDFTYKSRDVHFAGTDGEQQTFVIDVQGDSTPESDERFRLHISSATNGVSVGDSGWVTILDDDGTVQLSMAEPSFLEGTSAGSSVTRTITATLHGPIAGGTTLTYSTNDGSAKAGSDYITKSGTVTFAGHDGESHTFTVQTAADAIGEPDETFTVSITSSNPSAVAGSPLTLTIVNDDRGLQVDDVALEEGASGTKNMTFTVTHYGTTAGGTSVDWSTADGTALAGSDYVAASGTLVFNGTQNESKTFQVAIYGDTAIETHESFTVKFVPSNGSISYDPSALGTIIPDELGLSIGDTSGDEGANSSTRTRIELQVKSYGEVPGGFTVAWATEDGTATSGVDYGGGSGMLTFSGTAGEVQRIALYLYGDGITDANETFLVRLGSRSNPAIPLVDGTALVSIQDGGQAATSVVKLQVYPTATGIQLPLVLTDFHVGTTLHAHIEYDRSTNYANCAGITFDPYDPSALRSTCLGEPLPWSYPTAGEDASRAIVQTGASWISRYYIKLVPQLVDTNEELFDVDVQLRGGVGSRDFPNVVSVDQIFPNVFTVDTKNPTVVSLTPSLTTIGDADIGSARLALTIAYSEEMNPAFTPSVAFPNDDVASTLTRAGGSWTNTRTYVASFDVADANLYRANIDVHVSGGRDRWTNDSNNDIRANLQVPATIADVFTIATALPPSVSLSAAPAILATGASATLSVRIENPNAFAVHAAALTMTLPSGLAIADPNGVTGDCGGTVTAVAGAASIALAGGTIPASGHCTLSVDLTSNAPGSYDIALAAGALTSNSGPSLAAATTSISFNGPLGVSMSIAPANIDPGETATVTIALENPNPAAVTGIAFTNTLPAGVTLATPAQASTMCDGATLATTASSVSFTGGSLPVHQSCSITFDVTSSVPGSHTNALAAGAVTATNAASSTGGAEATVSVAPFAGIGVETQFDANVIARNAPSRFSLTLSNTNAAPLSAIAFTQTLPAGLTVASTPSPSNSCGGTFSADAGDTSLSLTGAALAAHATCSLSVELTSTHPGTYSVDFGTGAITSAQSAGSEAATATLTVLSGPAATITIAPSTIAPGEIATITITLANANAVAITGAAAAFSLPANVELATTPNASTTCGGSVASAANAIALSAAGIAAGGACTITFDVTSAVSGTHTLAIAAGSVNSGNAGTNASSASATLTVDAYQPPVVSLAIGPTATARDTAIRLSVTIANDNAAPIHGLAFELLLPANVTIAPDLNPTNGCGGTITTIGNRISLIGGMAAASAQCTVAVDIAASAAGIYSPALPIGSVTSTNAGANAIAASATTTIFSGPSPSLAFTPAAIGPGSTSTLTITLANANAVAVTSVAFAASLPANVIVAPAPNVSTTCGGTASASGSSLSLSGATIEAGGSCTMSLDVTSTITGTHVWTLDAGAVSSANGGTNENAASAALSIGAYAPPAVSMGIAPSPIARNTTSTLTVHLTNANHASIDGVTFDLALPPSVRIAATPNLANPCGGLLTASGSTIALSGAAIAASSMCTVSVDLTSATPGSYTPALPIGSVTSTNAGANVIAASATLLVLHGPEATISMLPSTIAPGEQSHVTLTLSNPNSVELTSVALTSALPPQVTIASTPITTCGGTFHATANAINLAGGSIAATVSCTVTFDVTSSVSGAHAWLIAADAISTGNAGTNALPASGTLTVGPYTAPAIGVSIAPATIARGETARLTIVIANANAAAIQGVAFARALPAGVRAAAAPNASNSCGGTFTAGTSLTLANAIVPPATSCTIAVDLTGTIGGTYTIAFGAGEVTSTNAPPNADTASASLLVLDPPALDLAFDPAAIAAGETSQLSLSITNTNAVAITGAALSVSLPTHVTIAAVDGATTTCGATLALTAARDGFTLANATIAPSSSCTAAITVTSIVTGTHTVAFAAGALTTSNAGANDANVAATLTIGTYAPPAVAAEFSPARIARGGRSTVTIRLSNPNAAPLTGVSIANALPLALTIASPAVATTDCGGTLQAPAGATSFSLSGAVLPVHGVCSIAIEVTGTQAGGHSFVVPLDAVTSAEAPPSAVAAKATLLISSPPTVDLSFTPAAVPTGAPSTLRITLGNANDITLTGVQMQHSLAPPLNGAIGTNTCGGQWTLDGGVLHLANAAIPAGGTCGVTASVSSASPGTRILAITAGEVQSANAGANIAGASATLDVRLPVIRVDAVSVSEGAREALLQLTLDAPSPLGSRVRVRTQDGEATEGADYIATETVVTFPGGASTRTLRIPIVSDDVLEESETFTLLLSNPDNATLGTTTARITIEDDELPPVLTIQDLELREGSEGTTRGAVMVLLSGPASEPVVVEFQTTAASATAGVDFVMQQGTIAFAPGELTKEIELDIIGDRLVEDDETFTVTISSILPIGRATAVITILNDESGRRRAVRH